MPERIGDRTTDRRKRECDACLRGLSISLPGEERQAGFRRPTAAIY